MAAVEVFSRKSQTPFFAPDAFAPHPTLDGFDLYAADGHAHAAAAHDAPQPSKASETGYAKYATSHIYARNLRTHGLSQQIMWQ